MRWSPFLTLQDPESRWLRNLKKKKKKTTILLKKHRNEMTPDSTLILSAAIREDSSCSIWDQIQRHTAGQCAEGATLKYSVLNGCFCQIPSTGLRGLCRRGAKDSKSQWRQKTQRRWGLQDTTGLTHREPPETGSVHRACWLQDLTSVAHWTVMDLCISFSNYKEKWSLRAERGEDTNPYP